MAVAVAVLRRLLNVPFYLAFDYLLVRFEACGVQIVESCARYCSGFKEVARRTLIAIFFKAAELLKVPEL